MVGRLGWAGRYGIALRKSFIGFRKTAAVGHSAVDIIVGSVMLPAPYEKTHPIPTLCCWTGWQS